ncbi:MAG: hypothetical protein ABSA58_15290 [Acetobacteraceae bacterium]|jgi:hypothetical protein
MPQRQHSSMETTYGAMRAIERLTLAADTIRGTIMHEVTDRDARAAALALVSQALGVAVQGIA